MYHGATRVFPIPDCLLPGLPSLDRETASKPLHYVPNLSLDLFIRDIGYHDPICAHGPCSEADVGCQRPSRRILWPIRRTTYLPLCLLQVGTGNSLKFGP